MVTPKDRLGRLAFPACLALWLGLCGAGFWVLFTYQNTPGDAGSPRPRWPAGSPLSLGPDRSTLVLFAHPRCPCTRASLDSLAWTMARTGGKLTAYVLFFKPAGFGEDWVKTDLWDKAAAIPGVRVLSDEAGAEAVRFGAETSGQLVLYDSRGSLLFSGGITGARGHFGDNEGRDAVASLVARGNARESRSQVFGCALMRVDARRPGEARTWKAPNWIKSMTRI